ncbi:MAG: threonine--tRNA ligase [bacterium]
MKPASEKTSLEHKRHTLAHLLAKAVLSFSPDAKTTIGPATENGFYYDFEFPLNAESKGASATLMPGAKASISEKDLPKIEKKMREFLHEWHAFTHIEVSPADARKIFAGNPYKLELIDGIVERKEKITLYTCGEGESEFTDLCRGGHAEDPSKEIPVNSFKLTHIAGAYWRGSEANKMLTRIYGLAFETKEALDQHETMVEEAKKRDHKKIGREMGLFTISPLVGAGLPLMQPKGMVIRNEISDFLWNLHKDKGYSRVWTPHIAREELYVMSGHAAKFGDELFRVQGKEEKFIMKPMNCPHHMQIFADNQFSYRQMPVRYFEPATVYRDEKSGQLGGLTRVRAITQDDGHLFCSVAQIEQEVATIVNVIKEFYAPFGLMKEYWVSLSVRGEDRSKYLGTDDVWNTAESSLEKAAKANNLPYKRVEGEAAFYGPKLDFMFKDSIGREWQLATIQCDFNLPERFDLSFTNDKGLKERPVVIHRAISGSLERFMGIIIEHYAGAFPLWLAPTQVKIIPIGEAHHAAASAAHTALVAAGVRSELCLGNEGFGKLVRQAKTDKIPYFVVIGDKDLAASAVTLESRDKGNLGQMKAEEVVAKLAEEIERKG